MLSFKNFHWLIKEYGNIRADHVTNIKFYACTKLTFFKRNILHQNLKKYKHDAHVLFMSCFSKNGDI